MSCGFVFNRCSDASDLSSAKLVVPLTAAIEDGATHVYIARSIAADRTVDGEIVRVPNEVMASYKNDNLFKPVELTHDGIFDFMNHSITEALQTIEIEGTQNGIEDFDVFSDVFSTPDDVTAFGTYTMMDDEIHGQDIMNALNAALESAELAAQQANNGELPEEKYIGSYSESEMAHITANWANAVNETVDRMHLARGLLEYREDLAETISNHTEFDDLTIGALMDEINNGPTEGGPQHYDHRINMGLNQ